MKSDNELEEEEEDISDEGSSDEKGKLLVNIC